MLKLESVTFDNAPRIPGVRPGDLTTVQCETPTTPLIGWRLLLRGNSVFFVSPKGWRPGIKSHEWDQDGPTVIHEVPRMHVFFHWSGDIADIDATIMRGKFETPPFGPPLTLLASSPGKGLLAQLDPAQLGDP